MDGVGIHIDITGLEAALSLVSRLAGFDASALLTDIAALGESQTRRRIEEEKTAPDGSPWLPNAEGTSILLRTGMHLRDSIASTSGSDFAEWGSSWEYAHVHQDGATIVPKNGDRLAFHVGGKFVRPTKSVIPARPFVGISDDNAGELRDLVSDYMGGLLQ